MHVRVARHTDRLAAVVAFYRDGVGLTDLGGFEDHDGYSGALLGIPGAHAHLEFTTGGTASGADPHPESLLVLYLGSPEAVRVVVERCGAPIVASANPYWDREGAVTLLDPDGCRVVLSPDTWA